MRVSKNERMEKNDEKKKVDDGFMYACGIFDGSVYENGGSFSQGKSFEGIRGFFVKGYDCMRSEEHTSDSKLQLFDCLY